MVARSIVPSHISRFVISSRRRSPWEVLGKSLPDAVRGGTYRSENDTVCPYTCFEHIIAHVVFLKGE